jgi:hypothetical protein
MLALSPKRQDYDLGKGTDSSMPLSGSISVRLQPLR